MDKSDAFQHIACTMEVERSVRIGITTCSSRRVHLGHGIVRDLGMMAVGSIVVRRRRRIGGPIVASRDHVRVVGVLLRHLAGAVVFIGRRRGT